MNIIVCPPARFERRDYIAEGARRGKATGHRTLVYLDPYP